ncbi:MAG TPA: sigma-70 family RNA polymerase sigma factor [Opitutales bacterium]|jgi:RNA polymerase sigma factor (sigma-70 family)|nr:sigma-70 family RNA polymerase sigma factor [Opitutales bacterium]
MNDQAPTDDDLLRQYTQQGSEAAFRELVTRHLGMVQATSRRALSPMPHLADDVTQQVFTDLAKLAATLSPPVVLAGWLHRHAYYLALNAARAERRRHARERTAMEMQSLNDNSGMDTQWAQLAPVLDAALDQLDEQDRAAIVLRYLQHRDLRSVGLALGISDDTAQKRVSRALTKLRAFLIQSGVTVASATALGSTLEACPASVVAPGRAASVAAMALTGVAIVTTATRFTLGSKRLTSLEMACVVFIIVFLICCWRFYPSAQTTTTKPVPDDGKPAATTSNLQQSSHELVFVEEKPNGDAAANVKSPGAPANSAASQNPTAAGNKSATAGQGFQFAAGPQSEIDSLIVSATKSAPPGQFNTPEKTVAPGNLSVKNLPMFMLSAESIANGGGMKDAVLTGNYLIALDASGQALRIEEMVGSTDHSTLSYRAGAGAQIIPNLLTQLAALPQVQASSFEPRILWLDNVISLIWLKSNTDAPDIFYLHNLYGRNTLPSQAVLRNLPSEALIQFDTIYNLDDLMKLAVPIAQEMVAMDQATAARNQAQGIQVIPASAMGGSTYQP